MVVFAGERGRDLATVNVTDWYFEPGRSGCMWIVQICTAPPAEPTSDFPSSGRVLSSELRRSYRRRREM